eukprot:TRINITY_DN1856_c0_g1_i1.p1 TRINITY_DN1856_c0_g1~~TRINITY_DN1856_c0_g1_i1.p1  ORF type:complete len:252 (+),score=27.10 TRINITY_DN1856_c0_g1_i1:77-832(+)
MLMRLWSDIVLLCLQLGLSEASIVRTGKRVAKQHMMEAEIMNSGALFVHASNASKANEYMVVDCGCPSKCSPFSSTPAAETSAAGYVQCCSGADNAPSCVRKLSNVCLTGDLKPCRASNDCSGTPMVTFADAQQLCSGLGPGWDLCSVEQVATGACCDTGCYGNIFPQWTRTPNPTSTPTPTPSPPAPSPSTQDDQPQPDDQQQTPMPALPPNTQDDQPRPDDQQQTPMPAPSPNTQDDEPQPDDQQQWNN